MYSVEGRGSETQCADGSRQSGVKVLELERQIGTFRVTLLPALVAVVEIGR